MAKRLAIEIFITAAIGLVLGLFGPFGTYAQPLAVRLIYWTVFGIAGYAIFRPIIVVGTWFSQQLGTSLLIGRGIALLVAACPMTVLVEWLMRGFDARAALLSPDLGERYLQVWLIGTIVHLITSALFHRSGEAVPPHRPSAEPLRAVAPAPAANASVIASTGTGTGTATAPRAPRFLDRLPPGFGALLALKAEDHYVRAIGTTRETLILIRLRDAMAELGNDSGVRVHRSWWVASDAVTRVERSGRAAELILSNGTRVPVSRENMGLVRGAGWETA